MKLFFLLFTLFSSAVGVGQGSFFERSDTLNSSRVIGVTSSVGGTSIAGMTGLWFLWYRNSESGKWKFSDDFDHWMQMDKAGHFYTAYKLNQTVSDLYSWSGLSHRKATFIGFGYSMAFQTTLEIFDGYSSDWGFSGSDIAFNALGSASYTTQQLIWKEERIIPKFSSFPSSYAALRPEVLGSNFAEQTLKDYNGQTYWLSFSPGSFIRSQKYPKWLCFSLGYSVDAKIVGDEDVYISGETLYEAKRQFLFSMDVDFSRIPVKRVWLRNVLKQLNYLKVPFPAIMLSNGQFSFKPFYF